MSHIKENIIQPAWNLIATDTKLKNFYFLPGLLSIIFLTIILVYQTIYTYVVIFWQQEKALELILEFFHSTYVKEILISWLVFLIIYIVLIPIFEWWLINYIDKKHKEWWNSSSDALWYWLYRFLPMFEYSNSTSQFKFISLLNLYLFAIRFTGVDYIKFDTYIFTILLFIWIIINILFSYSKYLIILENKKATASMSGSTKITILNIGTTIRLYFMMFLLNLRVIINFAIFLLFPVLFAFAITYITSQFFLWLTTITIWILFIFFILFLWYLTAVLDIFTTSIWYFAYLAWKDKVKDDNDEDDE